MQDHGHNNDRGAKRKKDGFFDVKPTRKKLRLQLDDENSMDVTAPVHSKKIRHGKPHQQEQHEERVQHEVKRPKSVFPYGNYNRYYDIRYKEIKKDPRIDLIEKHAECDFKGKDCLDIGCNVGLFTLQLADHLKVRSIKGIDIDSGLIRKANKILDDLKEKDLTVEQSISAVTTTKAKKIRERKEFILQTNGKMTGHHKQDENDNPFDFPNNVTFERQNFVENEEIGDHRYDVIFCLSVTKWVHLNNGDEGIKLLFRKIYNLLKPGGLLVLEPQNWKSYTKQSTLTKKIAENFPNIKFRPKDFKDYLLKDVGFVRTTAFFVEDEENANLSDDGVQNGGKKKSKKGFNKRPICFYYKASPTENQFNMESVARTDDDAMKE